MKLKKDSFDFLHHEKNSDLDQSCKILEKERLNTFFVARNRLQNELSFLAPVVNLQQLLVGAHDQRNSIRRTINCLYPQRPMMWPTMQATK